MEPSTVIGVLLTALVTLLLTQVKGMREDFKAYQKEQKDESEKATAERKIFSDRLTILETEHKAGFCRFRGEA